MKSCFLPYVIMSYILYTGSENISHNSRVLFSSHRLSHIIKDGGYINIFKKFNYNSKPKDNLARNKWKKNKPRSKI